MSPKKIWFKQIVFHCLESIRHLLSNYDVKIKISVGDFMFVGLGYVDVC